MSITLDKAFNEWFASRKNKPRKGDGINLTIEDIHAKYKLSYPNARAFVRAMLDDGKMECVSVIETNLTGKNCRKWYYRIKSKSK